MLFVPAASLGNGAVASILTCCWTSPGPRTAVMLQGSSPQRRSPSTRKSAGSSLPWHRRMHRPIPSGPCHSSRWMTVPDRPRNSRQLLVRCAAFPSLWIGWWFGGDQKKRCPASSRGQVWGEYLPQGWRTPGKSTSEGFPGVPCSRNITMHDTHLAI